jgi:hypothetical protein
MAIFLALGGIGPYQHDASFSAFGPPVAQVGFARVGKGLLLVNYPCFHMFLSHTVLRGHAAHGMFAFKAIFRCEPWA